MIRKTIYQFIVIGCALAFTHPTYAFFFGSKCKIPSGINIDTSDHRLTICDNNKVVKEFPISLGRGGIGKKQRDDKKTPLGLYGLQMPHKSQRFGTFIPIQYPTPQQRAEGFTGSDVGIHGPVQKHSWFTWLNKTTTTVDWTFGCIAVENNNQIDYIANWVETHRDAKVMIS
jgi:murein L,D-transpeptidase YafK